MASIPATISRLTIINKLQQKKKMSVHFDDKTSRKAAQHQARWKPDALVTNIRGCCMNAIGQVRLTDKKEYVGMNKPIYWIRRLEITRG